MNMKGSFGGWLKQRRKALDLTQAELADLVGCALTTIQKIEADLRRPSKQITEQLVDVLAISPDERTTFLSFARRVVDHPVSSPIDLESRVPTSNLPMQSMPFLGRETELAQIATLLADPACRLLTLVGVGGIGKTRLALQAAAEWVEDFVDGVYFVSLTPVGSATLIAAAIANVLQLSFQGQEDPNTQVVNYLRGKHMLLIMDNYEHLLPELELLNALLANAPRLKILATSRERLNLHEEWVLQVEGLSFPAQSTNEEVGTFSAVQLFMQTARRLQPHFSLEANQNSVIDICQAVEGMPLGIELASTWLRAMPCQQIAGQIRRDLNFLTTPLRDVPERHRSMRAVFEHSWGLLSEAERNVLMKLSVFRGGIDAEAAEQVAGASLPLLAGFVDKSLVRLNTAGRYELHELLRQFAADKLQEANKTAETQQRHFQYFLGLAEQLDRYFFGPQNVVWMDRLETELDNNRAALDWVWQIGDAHSGLRLTGALGWFWIRREYWKEGREWLEKFRASRMDIPIAVRAKAHHYAMELGESVGDHAYTTGLCEEGFRLARDVEDPRLTAWLLLSLGAFGRCPNVSVEDCLEEALALFRKLGDRWGICESIARLGHTLVRRGDFVRGRELEEEGIRLARQSGDKSVLSWLVFVSAVRNRHEGGSEQQTESLYRESLAMFQELRCKGGTAAALLNVAGCAYIRGDDEQATALFQSSLRLSQRIGDNDLAVFTLLRLGDLFCRHGESQRGTRLLGLLGDLLPIVGYGSSQKEIDGRMSCYNSGLAAARAELGEEAFAAAFAEGQRMTLDRAIAYALDQAAYMEPI